MASLTPFQEKKIVKVFSMLYDSNKDGVIEKKDFEILLKDISGLLNWGEDNPKYKNAKETLDCVWKGLKEYADADKDAKITQDEWKKMWGDCLKDLEKGQFPDWQKRYMDLMFDVNDKSGDDCIDQGEYTTFMSHYGLSQKDCATAFAKISGGKGITRDKFAALWKAYLTSNDKSMPENYLFGPILE